MPMVTRLLCCDASGGALDVEQDKGGDSGARGLQRRHAQQ
jgi:hypothetical protein